MKKAIDEVIALLEKKDEASCDKACHVIEEKLMVPQGYPEVDRSQLESQIPGGMLSNLYNQLKEQDKLDMLPEVQKEIPKVRKDAGYLPLVTPTSQIVGTQATFNVMQGSRYAFVSEPFRDMVMGRYGRTPGPVDSEMIKKVSQGKEPFTGRPADEVADIDLAKAFKDNQDIIKNHRDLLLLLLFPAPAKAFFSNRK